MNWPFFHNPHEAAGVGFLLTLSYAVAVFWRRPVTWPMLVAACSWYVYSLWEWFCMVKEFNIRVDLFVIPWILGTILLLAIIALFFGSGRDDGHIQET